MPDSQIRTRPARPAAPPIRRYAAKVFATLAGQTKYVDPGLAAAWGSLVGEEIAKLCRPGRLSGGRLGRTLEVVAPNGAAATRVQFEAETIRRAINGFLGPGAVGRIAVRQSAQRPGDEPPGGGGASPLGSALSRFRASISARGKAG